MLAPGLFRCRRIHLEPGWGPQGTELYPVECGREYQEAVPGLDTTFTCRCRTLAVRSCVSCERPVCHDDSRRSGDSWMCRWCVAERQAARQAEEAARARDEHRRYAALPALTPALLERHLRGELAVTDGVTHQTLDLRNKDVFDVVFGRFVDREGAFGGGREVFWLGEIGFDDQGAVYEPEDYDGPYEITRTRPKLKSGAAEPWREKLEPLRSTIPSAATMARDDLRFRSRRSDQRVAWRVAQVAALAFAVAMVVSALASNMAVLYLPMLASIGFAMFAQSRLEQL